MNRPRRFAVLGDPIAHSKSPAMHMAAYRALGLPHSYEAIRATEGELPGLVDALRKGTFEGFNITVPHKTRILDFVDMVDVSASRAGAANTLVRTGGKVHAYNTDTAALAKELRELAPELGTRWTGKSAVVIGTGGAARSAEVALAVELGARRIVARGRSLADLHAADRFAHELGELIARSGPQVEIVAGGLTPDPARDAEAVAIVQTTSAGMSGADDGAVVASAVDWDVVGPRAVALDVVYAPPRTPFLVAAERHAIRCANGHGMLARQGALAFELWLHVPAPYNAMLTTLT